MIPKLRAWDKEDKKMSYGELEYFDDMIGYRFGHFCLGADYEVEIMQYTGLKDKNGVEIYEGDILKGQIVNNYHRVAVVDFSEGCFIFKEFWRDGLLTEFEEESNSLDFYYNLEILGNIYENPELLEEVTR